MKFEQEVLLIFWAKVEHLLARHDGGDATEGLVVILVRAPSDVVDLTSHNE